MEDYINNGLKSQLIPSTCVSHLCPITYPTTRILLLIDVGAGEDSL